MSIIFPKLTSSNKLIMRRLLSIFVFLLLLMPFSNHAQVLKPIHISTSTKDLGNGTFLLSVDFKIDPPFHVYSQKPGNDDVLPTALKFKPSSDYELIGALQEVGNLKNENDPNFGMALRYYENKLSLQQKVKLKKPKATISADLEYMTCDDHQCLPPKYETYTFTLTGTPAPAETAATNTATLDTAKTTAVDTTSKTTTDTAKTATISTSSDDTGANDPWWKILLNGMLAGLIAIFMPCVFPMIPLTVSFFTKRSGTKAQGVRNALLYGGSMILLFVSLGFLVGNSLNAWASSAFFNLIFFVVFIIFAISFLGAFEIVLPNWIIQKSSDNESKGGLIGIFFMAFTMVLVSFSCTGPFITWAINVKSASPFAAAIAMFGFGFMFSLPFMFFAFFPGWLQSLPKSGSWLNSIKVAFGFIELAAAFKFLSNVDQAYHWQILPREVFLVIWIVIFALLGFYLLGKIRLHADDDLPLNDYGKPYLTVTRLLFSILAFCFTIYLVPGLWGAPLKIISGFPPPVTYTEGKWINNVGAHATSGAAADTKVGGFETEEGPHGLRVFRDYATALKAAKVVHKPVFVDFTGYSCVNCRKMEESVWSEDAVLKQLQNDYVVVSLFVDDREKLPADQQAKDADGNLMTTKGQLYTNLQITRFNKNAQPYYVLMDENENVLNTPSPANFKVAEFAQFLTDGVSKYKK